MKINNITHAETNETRTDDRYRLRIGCEVEIMEDPYIGHPMYLLYIKDNQGNPKQGILRTSAVYEIEETDNQIIVETRNSVYYLDK